MGFTYNVIIFGKIQNMPMCVFVLHGTETNGNLDCSYYETCTHKKFSGILGLEQFTGSTGSDTS